VVEHAKKQAKGQVDQIDWATGKVKTKWEKFVENAAEAINAVGKGLEWVSKMLGLKWRYGLWIPEYLKKSKKYAKGTPKSGHPGGPAIVGEKGPELAYIPKVGVTLLGTRGAEFIPNLPRGTAVLPNKHTEKLLKSYGFPGYEKGVGDFFSAVLKGPKAVVEKMWKKYKPSMSGLGGTLATLGKGIISFLKDKSLTFVKDKIKDFFSIGDSKGTESVRRWIMAAMRITGVPASWLNPLVTIAMRESGGNPRAINLWDINAKRGTPSKGLFQTIDPTFNAYKLPGLDNIWNPIHNAVAAIRYIIARYGTVWNVPGIRNLMRGKGYVGYAEGTPSSGHPGGPAIVGEEGRELAYIPGKGLALLGTHGPTLLDLPRGTAVLPNRETERLLKAFNVPGYADGVGKFPQIEVEGYRNVDQLVNSIADSIKESLQALQDRTIQIEIPVILDGREIARASYRYVTELQQKELSRTSRFEGR
jgi:SLT domain-containing protein